MDRINNRLKDCKALRRQADTSANYNAGITSRGQVILHRLPGRSIRTDVANIALPSPVCHLSQRKRNTGADLLSAHTRRKSRIRIIHGFRVVADQQNSCHHPYLFEISFRNRSDYGFRNSSGSLAIFAATLLSSSRFATLIADPRIGRRGKCPVRRLLHAVESNQRDRSQHDRREAGS